MFKVTMAITVVFLNPKYLNFYTTDRRNEQEKDMKAKEQTQSQNKLTRKSGHQPLSGKHEVNTFLWKINF